MASMNDPATIAKEIAEHTPAGGIGLHGSTWEKAESIQNEGLVVNKSKKNELFMYIIDADQIPPSRRTQDLTEKFRLAAGYAVSRSLSGHLFSSLQEAANRSEDMLPEAELPSVSIFFSDDRYLLNQMFEPDPADNTSHAAKVRSDQDVPAQLVQGTVRLENDDLREALQNAESEVKTRPTPEHTLTDKGKIETWLKHQKIEESTPIALALFQELSIQGTLTPSQAARAIESTLFKEQCAEQLSAKVEFAVYDLALPQETPSIV